jgi:uncharacterized protein
MLYTKEYQKSIKFSKNILHPDEFSARAHISQAAGLGLGDAQLHLGKAHRNAKNKLSLPVDNLMALHYAFLASVHGQPEGHLIVSELMWSGQSGANGWPVNERMAVTFARMSANDGHKPSYIQLGNFYEVGVGVQANYQQAKAWYLKAAATGDQKAIERLDGLRDKRSLKAFTNKKKTT